MISSIPLEQLETPMQEKKVQHTPVMLREVIEYLNPKAKGVCFDGTLGLGGHAIEIIKHLGLEGCLIGIDRDAQSLEVAKENLKDWSQQCRFCHNDFRNIDKVLDDLGIKEVDGILLDLGISSFQLNNPQRGFSIRAEGPLDMRMDQEAFISAYDLINSLPEKEIALILKNFGQERWHNRIARYLVFERAKNPIETTAELSQIVLRAIPHHQKRQKIHPATRTFQAFRIAVNRELESLELALDKCIHALKPNGRIVVISFHSLEDKIVKEKFKSFARSQGLKILTKKPLRPSEEESNQNPRARSARLRAAERI